MEARFENLKLIGKGSFEDVFRGFDKELKEEVAIKVIDLEEAEDKVEDIQKELSVISVPFTSIHGVLWVVLARHKVMDRYGVHSRWFCFRLERIKMVSDAEIVRHLTAVLRQADLSATTTTAIRQQLQTDLGVDLSEKKLFIRQHVDLYLRKHSQEQQEGEGEGEERGDGVGKAVGRGDEEDEEGGDGGEGEEDEKDSRKASKSFKPRGDPDSKRIRSKIDHAIKASLTKEKKKRTGCGGGLTKACALSPELQVIIGKSELPRTQVVKQLWVYIREHSLQDPGDKRKIVCDDALRNLLGTNCTDMFKMNKLLSRHIWPLDNGTAISVKSADRDTDAEEIEPKSKKLKTDKSRGEKSKNIGFLAPCPISDQLSSFLGVEDGKVSRADAVKRLWDYIKEKKLQDPSNKKMILCDELLQSLFKCDQFVGFDLTKLLTRHFMKSQHQ